MTATVKLPPYATIRRDEDTVVILDQRELPFAVRFLTLRTLEDTADAIRTMAVRGAPLIGVTAAFGVALALQRDARDAALDDAITTLATTRPTAVNLHWALARMRQVLAPLVPAERAEAAWENAERLRNEDAALCHAIGETGLPWLQAAAKKRAGEPVRVLTHCNAGWVATCGIGTALAPVYLAHQAGIAVEVLASETRPRNQGLLTAWELSAAGIPAKVVTDNAAAWLLANGAVDLVIVGADRIAANGDVANKVGTALKAFAAHTYGIPFLVAAPTSTFDPDCPHGGAIPIEDRGSDELTHAVVRTANGVTRLPALPDGIGTGPNPAFDVTPARFVTAILTERGAIAPPLAGPWCRSH
ncbi:MAG TPA: S-methyl-5-thioribose-1-phosphate isomerase [Hydrogenophilus thermoluteolus]|nr:S-methyl-5-thioribose-1-phosphate isomerase [Hydrogenophilus thermoluteolus]